MRQRVKKNDPTPKTRHNDATGARRGSSHLVFKTSCILLGFLHLFHTRCIRMVPLLIQIRYGGAAAVEGEVDLKNACQLSSSTMPPSSRRHFEQRAANKACRRREAQQRGGNPHKTVTIQLFNGLPLVKYQSSHISHFCPSYISIDHYILASPHCQ